MTEYDPKMTETVVTAVVRAVTPVMTLVVAVSAVMPVAMGFLRAVMLLKPGFYIKVRNSLK